MTDQPIVDRQREIIHALGVRPMIDVATEIDRRTTFLRDHLESSGQHAFVLGISGGQDSFLAGKLAQLAVDRLNANVSGAPYTLCLLRLPYGVQRDAADAEAAVSTIGPQVAMVYDIKPVVDAECALWEDRGEALSDYVKGNLKARIRMAVQYDWAGQHQGLVIGTDHAAEALTGFYTKWGDGACDLTPLATLNKRQGRALAAALGAPPVLLTKAPTADLLDLIPGRPDEAELGLTYDQIDDFLEGRPVERAAALRLIARYDATAHKRASIPRI